MTKGSDQRRQGSDLASVPTFEDLARTLENELDLEPGIIKPTTEFERDLKFDSLAMMEAAEVLEDATGAIIPEEALANVVTAQDAYEILLRYLNPVGESG